MQVLQVSTVLFCFSPQDSALQTKYTVHARVPTERRRLPRPLVRSKLLSVCPQLDVRIKVAYVTKLDSCPSSFVRSTQVNQQVHCCVEQNE